MADWEAAYQLHAPEIRGYLRRRLPRPADAEDLCQETFSRVLQRDQPLRDPARLRSYLMRTAHNLLVNHLRRPRIVALGSEVAPDRELEDLPQASYEDQAFELADLQQRLERALAELPERQAEIFRRAVLQGEKYAAIAKDLGISLSAVKVTVFRARKQLCKLLDPEEVRNATM